MVGRKGRQGVTTTLQRSRNRQELLEEAPAWWGGSVQTHRTRLGFSEEYYVPKGQSPAAVPQGSGKLRSQEHSRNKNT